ELESLQGLHNINYVGSDYRIYNSPLLSDISAISNLSEVLFLTLSNCDAITDLQPFSNLSQVLIFALGITGCDGITDLQGLANLSGISDTFVLTISNNNSLTSLHGLESFVNAKNLFIHDNDA